MWPRSPLTRIVYDPCLIRSEGALTMAHAAPKGPATAELSQGSLSQNYQSHFHTCFYTIPELTVKPLLNSQK